MFRTAVKTALAAGAAVLVLTGCQPTKMGSAAIIGDERITTAALHRTVQEWNEQFRADPEANMRRAGALAPDQRLPMDAVSDSQLREALTRLVMIRLSDEVARAERIAVSPGQIDGLIEQAGGLERAESITLASGLPERHARDLARHEVILQTVLMRHGFGPGATRDRLEQAKQQTMRLYADAVRRLDVRINPRYGGAFDVSRMFDGSRLAVMPTVPRLSRGETGTGELPGDAG
ncbi:hypothetical protein [Thermomonospora cellulosilytica]|uniref:Lipoprotein n=1 Tax=Thermomonospora cellulosilytica TaxID=1411118 RepID=A0A7W3R7U5_9ACTN|nr:hypothetical protein [Thermomonospora cellulosilytica]MBA9003568.1 hypothetical protein [Thermomonospora cellulosilytica]